VGWSLDRDLRGSRRLDVLGLVCNSSMPVPINLPCTMPVLPESISIPIHFVHDIYTSHIWYFTPMHSLLDSIPTTFLFLPHPLNTSPCFAIVKSLLLDYYPITIPFNPAISPSLAAISKYP